MTDEQRRLLFEALLGDVSPLERDCPARQALERYAVHDVNAIEPIIDRWLDLAWKLGMTQRDEYEREKANEENGAPHELTNILLDIARPQSPE